MVQQLLRGSRKLMSQPCCRPVRAKQAIWRTCSVLAGPEIHLSPAQQGIKAKKKAALHLGGWVWVCLGGHRAPPHFMVATAAPSSAGHPHIVKCSVPRACNIRLLQLQLLTATCLMSSRHIKCGPVVKCHAIWPVLP